jgi:formate dehydrogenase subunit gamma
MSPELSRSIVRYSFRERLVHLVAAISYVYVLLTGLAFWTPGLYWIAVLLGGGFLSRMLHPWAGVLFALVVGYMVATWRRDMRVVDADRAWQKALGHYVRNDDAHMPEVGRFNYGQKQFFWLMAWSTVLLVASGVVLWFAEIVPASLMAIRQAAVLVHAVAALVTVGLFIVHLYMGLVVVPGATRAILRGDVSEAWARHHHRLWFESLSDRKR